MADPITIGNKKSLKDFVNDYLPPRDQWATWIHPMSKENYSVTCQKAGSVSADDFESCFKLLELYNAEDYKKSSDGWKPKAKRKEMRLLDLRYLLVKKDDEVQGFCSFMLTMEDNYFVIYCYEIHLAASLQGTGLGKVLMGHLDYIGVQNPTAEKIMLTCFRGNTRALSFYRKLGFEKDEYSPSPRALRNGTLIETDYLIMSKPIKRENS